MKLSLAKICQKVHKKHLESKQSKFVYERLYKRLCFKALVFTNKRLQIA